MIQHYFSIPYQHFTEKIISAYSLLKIVDGIKAEDVDRLKWIQENTHDKIMVSLWKLDRSINPTKGSAYTSSNRLKFFKNDATPLEIENGEGFIILTEDIIQHYLCEAINEVHVIVTRNIKGYKEEMKIDMDDTTQDTNFFQFGFGVDKKK
jgi:hypothetical protein